MNLEVQLPTSLTAAERRSIHLAAENVPNVTHTSHDADVDSTHSLSGKQSRQRRYLLLARSKLPSTLVDKLRSSRVDMDIIRDDESTLSVRLKEEEQKMSRVGDILREFMGVDIDKALPERHRTSGTNTRNTRDANKGDDDDDGLADGVMAVMSSITSRCEEWCHTTIDLLEMERRAEEGHDDEDTSIVKVNGKADNDHDDDSALKRMSARSLRALICVKMDDDTKQRALGGATILRFTSARGADVPLPPGILTPHDVVALRRNKEKEDQRNGSRRGVVTRVRDYAIDVAVDDDDDGDADGGGDLPEPGTMNTWRLDRIANDITHKRLVQAIERLASGQTAERLVDLTFNAEHAPPPRFDPRRASFDAFNDRLDDAQRRAVSLCVSADELALVHGPPGTGKTTAIVEVLLQLAIVQRRRVLVCAASNVAVDTICERLCDADPRMKARCLRLGHPARLLPAVLGCSLEARLASSDAMALARDARREADALLANAKRGKERRSARAEARTLRSEANRRETGAVKAVLDSADVVLATLTGAADVRRMRDATRNRSFDAVVIDEAAQALAAACWGAVPHASLLIMAGDHHQLPPTVRSVEAERRGLGDTLFSRLINAHGRSASAMLETQYRMHEDIMAWSSLRFYGNKLQAHDSVRHRILEQVEGALGGSVAGPLLFVDTAGVDGMDEAQDEETLSRYNDGEAALCIAIATHLCRECEVDAANIGIIAPYASQVSKMRAARDAGTQLDALEISTVDGFQGREKEIIIISCVRSNAKRSVGFVSDYRRMNVAVTRARALCIVVGDSETLEADTMLKSLVEHIEDRGEYASAQQLVDDLNVVL